MTSKHKREKRVYREGSYGVYTCLVPLFFYIVSRYGVRSVVLDLRSGCDFKLIGTHTPQRLSQGRYIAWQQKPRRGSSTGTAYQSRTPASAPRNLEPLDPAAQQHRPRRACVNFYLPTPSASSPTNVCFFGFFSRQPSALRISIALLELLEHLFCRHTRCWIRRRPRAPSLTRSKLSRALHVRSSVPLRPPARPRPRLLRHSTAFYGILQHP
jgi:hypothetical protein